MSLDFVWVCLEKRLSQTTFVLLQFENPIQMCRWWNLDNTYFFFFSRNKLNSFLCCHENYKIFNKLQEEAGKLEIHKKIPNTYSQTLKCYQIFPKYFREFLPRVPLKSVILISMVRLVEGPWNIFKARLSVPIHSPPTQFLAFAIRQN